MERAGIPRDRAVLAARIGELRVARRLNRNQLAEAAKLSNAVVKGLERGTREPGFSTLLKLCRGLEIASLDQLLGPSPLERLL